MNVTCGAEPCPVILNSTCVFYEGENLIYTGINANDNLEIALQKIDAKFQDASIGYIFNNGVIQTLTGQPVQLGGSLVQNTTISSGGYTFEITGSIESGVFITTGGTSSEFVKGDGSLDPTAYQVVGNYITALAGDGTASGPGAALLTLATVNAFPGTYGSSVNVPVVTVNSKGLVTSITSSPISFPSGILLFDGDVFGSGFTGSITTLTLDTVNANVYGSDTALKFSVNGKGLVTSAAPITALDIYGILGYTPVPNTRTITINGVTQNLSANRTWNVGTVTSVQLSMPMAFSVTTPPITAAGTINVVASGTIGQYINGAGQLANLPLATSGTSGSSGVSGQSSNIFYYLANTSATSGNPGASHLLWNNLTQISATEININHLTDEVPPTDIDIFLALISLGNTITIQDRNLSANYQVFTVSATPTLIPGVSNYWTVPVTYVSSGGTGTTNFPSEHELFISILAASGSAGTSGTSGSSGTTGTSGSSGSSGTSGTDGTSGTSGIAGTSGTSGSSVPLAIGSVVAGGTPGSVLFIDASNQMAQDNTNLFYDDANNILELTNLTINASSLDASTNFQMDSVSKGFLGVPRMDLTQRLAIVSPAIGLLVYQTDTTEGVYQYSSTGWQLIGSGGGSGGGASALFNYYNFI